ncbi:hypothetical protein Tco_0133655 [Tanacetum coccineum]
MAQQSIPCSPECKIIGKILLDHPLNYALNATADVPTVYLQQFWRIVSKVPVETPENPFVAPINIETIEAFMNRVGSQGVVDKVSAFYTKNLAQPWQTMFKWDFMNNVEQKKEAIQYPRFIKLIIVDLMKKFLNIPQRIEEDYHSIKDFIPLVSVYTTRNVLVRGMLILDVFLTEEICATDDFKKYETVFMGKKRNQTPGESCSPRKSHKITMRKKKQSTTPIPTPSDDRERDEVAEATILITTAKRLRLLKEFLLSRDG